MSGVSLVLVTLCRCGHGEQRHGKAGCERDTCDCAGYSPGDPVEVFQGSGLAPDIAPRTCLTNELGTLTGATYRQLDYWVRTGRLVPKMPASGSGSERLFTARHVHLIRNVVRLLIYGFELDVAFTIAEGLTDSGEATAQIDGALELTVRATA